MRITASRAVRAGAAALAAGALSLGAVHPALAHDVHPFGPYTVALGWLHEPAFVGSDNAVQVLVKQGDAPFTDITDKDLTVVVSLGSQKMDSMPMVPSADPDTGLGIPGEYEMHFIPTTPGNYTFHISGKVNGTPVDETVTASDKTFATVDNPTDVEFPNKVPTNSDLATKLDRVTSRVSAVEGRSIPPDSQPLAVIALIVAIVLGGGAFLMAMGARRKGSRI
ncbi:MAG TPA: hypothetical protein VMU20_10080 [Candidatus Dormibacteraeota bacterium]|nr:hypothetical protein [Candidatus Dormibacteraeota bacterium]